MPGHFQIWKWVILLHLKLRNSLSMWKVLEYYSSEVIFIYNCNIGIVNITFTIIFICQLGWFFFFLERWDKMTSQVYLLVNLSQLFWSFNVRVINVVLFLSSSVRDYQNYTWQCSGSPEQHPVLLKEICVPELKPGLAYLNPCSLQPLYFSMQSLILNVKV